MISRRRRAAMPVALSPAEVEHQAEAGPSAREVRIAPPHEVLDLGDVGKDVARFVQRVIARRARGPSGHASVGLSIALLDLSLFEIMPQG